MVFPLAVALATAHALAALVITAWSASQLHLLVRSLRVPDPRDPPGSSELPSVTVQLPIRNEASVVADLVASVGALDWPRDRLLVQVLDDSDDETTGICAAALATLARDGVRVEHLRRPVRQGFKAGALRDGLATAEGPYVAVLDADFRPHPDFLRRTVPLLHADPQLALVQARWGHLNRDASVYTRAQALHLDAHFTVEQRARSHRPLLMGFNGTAGVWRREAIDAAGGWSSDTLTEDLDLSFRAQLGGWRVLYVDAVEAPAELPADVRAIRTQQHRWMKGGAQVARKLLGAVWRSDLPALGKIQGTMHLLGGAVFLAVVVVLLVTPAIGPLRVFVPELAVWTRPAIVALSGALFVLLAFYGTTVVRRDGPTGVLRLLRDFVPFLSLSTGLAVHDSVAVLEGWAGRESPFVRTPKVGRAGIARYTSAGPGPVVIGELVLAGWGLLGLLWALSTGEVVLAAFLASQSVGCAAVALGGR